MLKFSKHMPVACFTYRNSLVKPTAATVLLALLAGCALQGGIGGHGANNVASMRGATAVGPQLSQFLDDAIVGSALRPGQSPWGPNAEIIIEERYYAASGRPCVQLAVTRQHPPAQSKLACRVEGQGWFTQRLVTDVLEADNR